MADQTQLNAAAVDALVTVRAYRGTDLYMAMIKLLDSIAALHLETLASAPVDVVPRTQGALSQVRKLRQAMVSTNQHDSPIG
ncbi:MULTISPECIES: hypothetical protein [unclassified Janthinobacterium]|uniref:hypothetical protein n=1 Tax=unclassified Janthinobacterium TaxID=2610881 RepID=UPI001621A57A|nr:MULTISPECIES: hypothetical protein [unclassified Janthinobacterium]MBB5610538.1 hypothetical protein [Janthinobacterium sp. S3T4]MBB5616008.1 hypothetical protein [Janthinobacterium sp. S3M3]